MSRIVLFSLFVMAAGGVAPAQAHWGHVGELAGHGHWIAIGAAAGAAALAAWLARPRKSDTETDEDAGAAEDAELEEETA